MDGCRAVVTIGAPSSAEHVTGLLGDGHEQIDSRGAATINIGGRPFEVKQQLLDDLANQPPLESLRKLRCALLILHAPLDAIVEIENASEIFSHALHPKSFVSLDGANHLLTRKTDAEYAAAVIAAKAVAEAAIINLDMIVMSFLPSTSVFSAGEL